MLKRSLNSLMVPRKRLKLKLNLMVSRTLGKIKSLNSKNTKKYQFLVILVISLNSLSNIKWKSWV